MPIRFSPELEKIFSEKVTITQIIKEIEADGVKVLGKKKIKSKFKNCPHLFYAWYKEAVEGIAQFYANTNTKWKITAIWLSETFGLIYRVGKLE